MYRSIHNIIKNEYDKRQKTSYDEAILRKEEIYRKFPRIEEIDNQIRFEGIRHNKMILIGSKPFDSAFKDLLKNINELIYEKETLLENNSYPKNYLEPVFQCTLCKDTGFVETFGKTEMCSCYRQQFINHVYNQSNLKLALNENFTSFNENYYPDVVDEARYDIKISPRENILKIKEKVLNFINNIEDPNERNLYFSGPTGVGKTFMINCGAAELINKGRTVLYQTAPSLFKIINDYKQKCFIEGYEDTTYINIFNVDVLVIDDLGTETWTSARYSDLLNILNTRQNNNMSKPCKTIISTNIGIKGLPEYYDERVSSRIIGSFDLFKFAGEDIRMLKKSGKTF